MDPALGRAQCRYPGCTRPARLGEGRGAPPRYCDLPEHHRRSADRERARLLAAADPSPPLDPDTDPDALLTYIAGLRRQLASAHVELFELRAELSAVDDRARAPNVRRLRERSEEKPDDPDRRPRTEGDQDRPGS